MSSFNVHHEGRMFEYSPLPTKHNANYCQSCAQNSDDLSGISGDDRRAGESLYGWALEINNAYLHVFDSSCGHQLEIQPRGHSREKVLEGLCEGLWRA